VAMFPPTPYATLAGFGPMTRTVACAALTLSVIARPDLRDWESASDPPPAFHRHLDADPRAWRIAWSPSLGYARVAPEVAAITASAAQTFAELGARVETVEHVLDDPWPTLDRLKRGLTAYAFRHVRDDQFALMDPMLVEEIRASRSATVIEHFDAQMERAAIARTMLAFHRDYDLLLTPTAVVPPFAVGRNTPDGYEGRSWCGLLYPFNLTRQPAASVPCGFTADGLPVGLQIVGRPNADLVVLQAARAFETARPWAGRRPPMAA
jgi:aspartyl-tRNA(Asn)/glutamyl-tRNA(Gln) amidotransferase subunit A